MIVNGWHHDEMPDRFCAALAFYRYRDEGKKVGSGKVSKYELYYRAECILSVVRFDPDYGWRFPEGVKLRREPFVICWKELTTEELLAAFAKGDGEPDSDPEAEARDDT